MGGGDISAVWYRDTPSYYHSFVLSSDVNRCQLYLLLLSLVGVRCFRCVIRDTPSWPCFR